MAYSDPSLGGGYARPRRPTRLVAALVNRGYGAFPTGGPLRRPVPNARFPQPAQPLPPSPIADQAGGGAAAPTIPEQGKVGFLGPPASAGGGSAAYLGPPASAQSSVGYLGPPIQAGGGGVGFLGPPIPVSDPRYLGPPAPAGMSRLNAILARRRRQYGAGIA